MKLLSTTTMIALMLTTAIFSCGNKERFNKDRWSQKDDPAFISDYRKTMINDLISHHNLKGLSYSQLIDTLGAPDFTQDQLLGYFIEERYGTDIDPIYSKSLLIYLSKDSIVSNIKLKEWKKGR